MPVSVPIIEMIADSAIRYHQGPLPKHSEHEFQHGVISPVQRTLLAVDKMINRKTTQLHGSL